MSMYFREHGKIYEPEFGPSRTKQSFKDQCDINRILARAQKAGTISHLQKHGAFYGDFAEAPGDLLQAQELLARGQQIFDELPAELRREFRQDPVEFFKFVNDPANKDRLEEVLPEIGQPGKYFLDVSSRTPPGALQGDKLSSNTAPAVTEDVSVETNTGGDTPTE